MILILDNRIKEDILFSFIAISTNDLKGKHMKKIGIIGAENSHSAAISHTINVKKRIPGFRVVAIWGETRKFAEKSALKGNIPTIVKKTEDMLGMVDAIIVDHRHGKHHLCAALPYLEAKIPLFIDKPFCYRLSEGKRFLDRAAKLRVPVTSFSTIPKQASFVKALKAIKKLGTLETLVTTGPCDIMSKYGGIFFYGIHQLDGILRGAGYAVESVQLNRGKTHSTATLFYKSGAVATMNLIRGRWCKFHISAWGEKGRVDEQIMSDEDPYLAGIKEFTGMFRTGKTSETRETILTPIAVLEALEKSLKEKRRVKVPKV